MDRAAVSMRDSRAGFQRKVVVRNGERVLVPDGHLGWSPRTEGAVPRTDSGDTAKSASHFRAPLLPCDTISRWKMVDADGKLYFLEHSGVWCAVSVVFDLGAAAM